VRGLSNTMMKETGSLQSSGGSTTTVPTERPDQDKDGKIGQKAKGLNAESLSICASSQLAISGESARNS